MAGPLTVVHRLDYLNSYYCKFYIILNTVKSRRALNTLAAAGPSAALISAGTRALFPGVPATILTGLLS